MENLKAGERGVSGLQRGGKTCKMCFHLLPCLARVNTDASPSCWLSPSLSLAATLLLISSRDWRKSCTLGKQRCWYEFSESEGKTRENEGRERG